MSVGRENNGAAGRRRVHLSKGANVKSHGLEDDVDIWLL